MNILPKLILSLSTLIYMGGANAALTERLDGIWEGGGQQKSGSQWSIRFTAENDVYQIEYPSLECSGTWTFESETSGSVTFFEDIDTGESRCVDGGTVEVLWIENNKLRYIYYLPNGRIDAFGELECSNCNINQNNSLFKNGILHIPSVDVFDGSGEFVTYEADLSLIPSSNPLAFELIEAHQK